MVARTIDLRRTGAILLVLLLHVAIITVFLRTAFRSGPPLRPAREIVLQFFRPSPPRTVEPRR